MARSGGDALKIQESSVFWAQRERIFDGNWPSVEHVERESDKRGGFCCGDVSWISEIPSCPVFTPSVDEFKDPLAYISSISPLASKYGICKIVSPILPSVPAGRVLMKEKSGFKFTTRLQPMSLSDWDSDDNKVTFLTSAQRFTFVEFEKLANKYHSRRFSSAAIQPPLFVETEFWKEMLAGKSDHIQYASDVDGSAFSSSPDDPLATSKSNLKVLSALPKSTLRLLDTIIPGVTEPMLYIGMLFSMFAWHVEDHYLYSINYHHCGAPKTWYGVPGDAAQAFETVVKEEIYDTKLLSQHGEGAAYDFLIGKTTMFPPSVLVRHGVPVYKAVQAPGEYVLTFPRSYHAGFSHGFNCGEAVNFAMEDWFPYGAAACRRYSLLNRVPLLPYEELLWKEAQSSEKLSDEKNLKGEISMLMSVRASFLQMMSFQHRVRWMLRERGAALHTSLRAPTNISCMLCKHMCYIAFLTCRCFPEPTCLNHAKEMRKCECGKERKIILHKDIKKMDALAQQYRSFVTIPSQVSIEDGMPFGSGVLEEDMLDGEDYGRYVPFEDMDAPELESPAIFGSSAVTVNEDADVYAKKCEDACVNKPKVGVAIRSMPPKRIIDPVRNRISLCFKKDRNDSEGRTATDKGILTSTEEEVIHERVKQQVAKVRRSSSGELVLLLRDIISELTISGSVEEVAKQWQAEARRLGLTLHYAFVKDQDGNHAALSYKACQRLKEILTYSQADDLEKLLRQGLRSAKMPVLGKRESSHTGKADRGKEDGSYRKRLCHGSESTFPAGSQHSFCMSSTSDPQVDQDFVDGQMDRGIRTNKQSYSADSNQLTRIGNAHSLKDTDRSRKVFPKFKVKGPSPPPFKDAEGSGENTLTSIKFSKPCTVEGSLTQLGSYPRFEKYSQAYRGQRTM